MYSVVLELILKYFCKRAQLKRNEVYDVAVQWDALTLGCEFVQLPFAILGLQAASTHKLLGINRLEVKDADLVQSSATIGALHEPDDGSCVVLKSRSDAMRRE